MSRSLVAEIIAKRYLTQQDFLFLTNAVVRYKDPRILKRVLRIRDNSVPGSWLDTDRRLTNLLKNQKWRQIKADEWHAVLQAYSIILSGRVNLRQQAAPPYRFYIMTALKTGFVPVSRKKFMNMLRALKPPRRSPERVIRGFRQFLINVRRLETSVTFKGTN